MSATGTAKSSRLRVVATLPGAVLLPEATTCCVNEEDAQTVSEFGQERQLGSSLLSVGSCVCRICHTNTSKEPLISPCRCKGSLAYVHLSCLERWLNQSCRSYCELCCYHFNAVKTPRYRWSEALRVWIRHPRNRRHMQSDLLIFTLLTIVIMGLIAVCLLGMRYFVIEGEKIGISKLWTKGAISFVLMIVVLGYVTTVYLLIKDQMSPWYRWWKNTVNVRLVMATESSGSSEVSTVDRERDSPHPPRSRTLIQEKKDQDQDENKI
ncbi:E3 ubiquitin-protein ligase MARCH2 [Cephus cinctus]|uniref:E3 ubiquitin-protein ligase MARCH2 n=1 Tax=Cephus cinctus TaxID=211228 RepID=A0AAJ7RKA5_CEPCN|nr:E3 ubiquitin-protein ligase MARCH2 [Cephus cinctus]